MTQLHADRKITNWLDLRGGYIYTHASSGNTESKLRGIIVNPAVVISGQPLAINFDGAGKTELTSHTGDIGFTLGVLEQLDFIADYRYQSFTQQGQQNLIASRSDIQTPIPLVDEKVAWDNGLHTLDVLLAVVPHSTLSLRAGLRFVKQDIVRKLNGNTTSGTRRSWNYSPVINASWRPGPQLRVSGQFEHRTDVDPYVRITPENTLGANLRVNYTPGERWGIDNTFSFRNRETEILDFKMRSRNNSTTAWYQPFAQLGLNAGFSYGSFFSSNTIAFQSGVLPLTGLASQEQFIDRTYFWGLRANPHQTLTLSFSGQLTRSTGFATISGESPRLGPLTWPAWDAEIAYSIRKFGKIAFGWQRSYYFEDLARVTDFSANGFKLRYEFSY